MSDVLYLVGAVVCAVAGVLVFRVTLDLFRQGPTRVGIARSVGHSVRAYTNGKLPGREGASGWRVMDGWHSAVDDDGATRFMSRSRLSDDCL